MSAHQIIRTTVVGSYTILGWMDKPSQEELVQATQEVITSLESAGLDLICDGELYRFDTSHPETNGMIEYFIGPMEGIRGELDAEELTAYQEIKGMGFRTKPPGIVHDAIKTGSLNLASPCKRLKDLATKPVKFTMTGPHMLSKTVANNFYDTTEDIAMAFADVLAGQAEQLNADVIQIDEANLPGHPTESEWALRAINRVLDAIPTTGAVHLCFGNYAGKRVQSGTWDALIGYLDGLHADHVVLECKNRPEDEIEVFKELHSGIGLGIGIVDIKTSEIESPDDIARNLDRISSIVGADRIKYIHPDCGFWMLERSVADAKIRALVQGRDLFLGN